MKHHAPKQKHMPAVERFTQLDSLRATLMFMGIIYHSGLVYISGQTWLVASSTVSPFFDYLGIVLHTFRMPAFFLLSGFLYALVLVRTKTAPFLRARARRLIIPLFTAGLLLNAAQYLAFFLLNNNSGYTQLNMVTCESFTRIYSGCWTIHLWFLVHLSYYFLIGLPIVWILKRLPVFPIPSPASMLWPLSIGFILVVAQPILSLSYRGVFNVFYHLPLIGLDGRFIVNLPFFLMGLILAHGKITPSKWTRLSGMAILLLMISWVALLWNFDPERHSIYVTEFLTDGRFQTWLFYAVAFQTTAVLIVVAARLPRPSPKFANYLADLALTVYLVHHLIIFLLAVLFTNTGLPIGLQFFIIVGLTSVFSLAIHHYIVFRSANARYYFNGRLEIRN